MANNNKESERAELHKTIWRIADDLRGSVDGWDFKSDVLGMLFYRFISEDPAGYLNEQERRAGTPNLDYAKLSDAEFGRAETAKRNEKPVKLLDAIGTIFLSLPQCRSRLRTG
jgi:type I restriction enzyme M protein